MSISKKYFIKDLCLDIDRSFFITSIIIKKSEYSIFDKKKDGDLNGVITFTIRDSKRDFVNCIVWGSDYFIKNYDEKFHIGDVVSIMSPRINLIHSSNSKTENYRPITSSPFLLTINEGISEITKYDGDSSNHYSQLLKIPFKPIENVLSLADMRSSRSGPSNFNNNEFIDLLVIVRFIKPIRHITTKKGIKQCREIIVMDQSLPGMSLTIWNQDYIQRSDNWAPLSTILFISDARIEYSDFYKSIVLGISGRTIIIEDPSSSLSDALQIYAATTPLQDVDSLTTSREFPELSSITNVMTVQKIYDSAEKSIDTEDEQFTALLFAVVTRFDLDGTSKFMSRRCIRCKCSLKDVLNYCDRESCIDLQINSSGSILFTQIFDIGVDFSDHTGTIVNCRLIDKIAEQVIGYNLNEFCNLSTGTKGIVKWKFLLERCTIKLLIKKKTVCRLNTFFSVLDMKISDPEEVAAKIKVY